MGCGQSSTKHVAFAETLTQQTPEDKALNQLKLIFQDMDLNADGSVNKVEFEAALRRNDMLPNLLKQANMNSLEGMSALDTNKDGMITWVEFDAFLNGRMDDLKTEDLQAKAFQAKVEETAEISAKELAERQLKIVFDNLRSDDSGKVSRAQLVDALKKDNGLVELLKKAEFKLDIDVIMCQFDQDKDGLVSWEEFVIRLKDTAKEEITRTGDPAAAFEVQIEDKPEERAATCGPFC